MLRRHVDVIALLLLGLGAFAFSRASEIRVVRASGMQVHRVFNGTLDSGACPFVDAFIPRFR